MLMKDAMKHSENFHLEQALLQDHLQLSDRDTTYEALEEAVARESYLTWLREQEMRTRSGQHGLEVRNTPVAHLFEVCRCTYIHPAVEELSLCRSTLYFEPEPAEQPW